MAGAAVGIGMLTVIVVLFIRVLCAEVRDDRVRRRQEGMHSP